MWLGGCFIMPHFAIESFVLLTSIGWRIYYIRTPLERVSLSIKMDLEETVFGNGQNFTCSEFHPIYLSIYLTI
jgi:hypothetical protein